MYFTGLDNDGDFEDITDDVSEIKKNDAPVLMAQDFL